MHKTLEGCSQEQNLSRGLLVLCLGLQKLIFGLMEGPPAALSLAEPATTTWLRTPCDHTFVTLDIRQYQCCRE